MAKIKGDTVNFAGVEGGGGGGGAKVPEDDYRVKVDEVKRGESKSSGNDMLTWRFSITAGKYKGKKLKPVYTVINMDSLWKLKNVLDALGLGDEEINIPKVMKKALGMECGVTVVDGEEYNGKIPSEIAEHMTLSELEEHEAEKDEDDDDSDDEPKAKKKGKKGKKKGKKKSDDDEDLEEMDLDGV
jgi:hypothetical protein